MKFPQRVIHHSHPSTILEWLLRDRFHGPMPIPLLELDLPNKKGIQLFTKEKDG